MAEATITERVVREETVTLVLNKDEAQALACVVARVGGDPQESARKHTARVSAALSEVGISYHSSDMDLQFSGHIKAAER